MEDNTQSGELGTVKRRRPVRFSLRGLLIVVTVGGVLLGLLAAKVRRYEAAIAWAAERGIVDDWDFENGRENERPRVPRFLQWLLGENFFRHIKSVQLNGGIVTDISPLAQFPELERVHILGTGLVDLRPLAGLTRLREVYVCNNQIGDLGPLAGLKSLKALDVADNRVVDLKPLASLKTLTWLRAENNQIRDIAPLAGLVDLNYVGLSGNRIRDCTALEGFKNLTAVDISDNPMPESQLEALRASLPKLIFWNGEDVKSRVVKGEERSRQGAKARRGEAEEE